MFCAVIEIIKNGSVDSDVLFGEKTIAFRDSLVDVNDIAIADTYISLRDITELLIPTYTGYLGSIIYKSPMKSYFVSKWDTSADFDTMLLAAAGNVDVAEFKNSRNAFVLNFNLSITKTGTFETASLPVTLQEFETLLSSETLSPYPPTPFI